MFDAVVSSGCSLAWGDELENREDRYAALVSKKYNARLYDFSLKGCPNELIAVNTINNISSLLKEKTINPQNTLAIVEWTFKERLTYHSKSDRYYFVSTTLSNKLFDDPSLDLMDLKLFYDHHTTPKYLIYNLIKNIHYTQSFFISKNIKYVFLFANKRDRMIMSFTKNDFNTLGFTPKINYEALPNVFDILIDIDKSKIVPTAFIEYCDDNNLKVGSKHHPLEDSHKGYNNLLLNFIGEVYD
jgi:hypothetical protein